MLSLLSYPYTRLYIKQQAHDIKSQHLIKYIMLNMSNIWHFCHKA